MSFGLSDRKDAVSFPAFQKTGWEAGAGDVWWRSGFKAVKLERF